MARRIGVVLGLGEFGFHLVKALSGDGCEVIAVDRNERRVDVVKEYIQKPITADITSREVLESVIPAEADFIVVSLGSIEASMISTLYLKEMGFQNIYVKAVTDEHERILRLLGVKNVIFPEKDQSSRLSARLMSNNMLDYLPLSDDFSIAEVAPRREMEGSSLKELRFRKRYNLSVIAIRELVPGRMVFTPDADFVIKMSDILWVIGKKENIDRYNEGA